jgi:hypothetical protein
MACLLCCRSVSFVQRLEPRCLCRPCDRRVATASPHGALCCPYCCPCRRSGLGRVPRRPCETPVLHVRGWRATWRRRCGCPPLLVLPLLLPPSFSTAQQASEPLWRLWRWRWWCWRWRRPRNPRLLTLGLLAVVGPLPVDHEVSELLIELDDEEGWRLITTALYTAGGNSGDEVQEGQRRSTGVAGHKKGDGPRVSMF